MVGNHQTDLDMDFLDKHHLNKHSKKKRMKTKKMCFIRITKQFVFSPTLADKTLQTKNKKFLAACWVLPIRN